MSTRRVADAVAADIGAQYVTATEFYRNKHHSLYEELLAAQVLVPLSCRVEGLQQKDNSLNFISPNGTGHIVKHFLQQSEAEVQLLRHVTRVSRRGALWEVESSEGQSEDFDAVVLTMPVPQILQLPGLADCLSEQQGALLAQVQYSSRFALVLSFSKDSALDLDYGLKYVSESEVIRYLSVEHQKRSSDLADLGPSLVVHTLVSFGSKHLEAPVDQVQPIIIEELWRLLPHLPQPISIKTHKWRFSQVLTSVPGCPGHMTLMDKPLLVLGGDAFTHSNFDGCVESALSVLRELTQRLD